MTVLLDTHALVWAVTAPDRLSAPAREVISDATVPLLVSAASAWEMIIKQRSGRWPEVAVPVRQFDRIVERLGGTHLPVSSEHALAAGGMDWEHTDPFDRALATQAMSEGVALVSRDRAFADLPGLARIW
ncbi:MAG: type II toxin-antitoxin system VapC family toxin [Geodermatophilaceae bacterium]|nr:type II toxin-antitoxin system VapC family toxin [Geodermatophilaceae bacterium]